MSNKEKRPRLFSMDATTAAAVARLPGRDITCSCLSMRGKTGRPSIPNLHVEKQDESVTGWRALVDLVEAEALARTPVFELAAHIAWDKWANVITLPRNVGAMKHVQEVRLYGSRLRRLPPEIGGMMGFATSISTRPIRFTGCPMRSRAAQTSWTVA